MILGISSSVRLKKPAEVNQGYLKELSGDTYVVKSGFIHMSDVCAGRNWYIFNTLVSF
jgi:hypothetical protein